MQKESIVWENLKNKHYRNDLKLPHEVSEKTVDVKTLPRYLITLKSERFDILFDLLGCPHPAVQESAWKLLLRLPTSHKLFDKIVRLEGIRDSE